MLVAADLLRPDPRLGGCGCPLVGERRTGYLPGPRGSLPSPPYPCGPCKLIEAPARHGYVVALDEFQYFNRKAFSEFCSLLQAAIDRLAADAERVPGGLVVLGSIHTEMTALLEDRSVPLYNRITDSIELTHLDIGSVLSILRDHADTSPERLLFLWTLFEGVPKFYRDCFEQQVLAAERRTLLRRIFFESSSPLRARRQLVPSASFAAGTTRCSSSWHAVPAGHTRSWSSAIRDVSGDNTDQIGGYLKALTERYRLIERKLPVFAPLAAAAVGTTSRTTSSRPGSPRWPIRSRHATSARSTGGW